MFIVVFYLWCFWIKTWFCSKRVVPLFYQKTYAISGWSEQSKCQLASKSPKTYLHTDSEGHHYDKPKVSIIGLGSGSALHPGVGSPYHADVTKIETYRRRVTSSGSTAGTTLALHTSVHPIGPGSSPGNFEAFSS